MEGEGPSDRTESGRNDDSPLNWGSESFFFFSFLFWGGGLRGFDLLIDTCES